MSTFPPYEPGDESQSSHRPTPKDLEMTTQPHTPSDPLAPNDPTRSIDLGATSQLPHLPQASAPYRVEPGAPVPDDRVVPEPPLPAPGEASLPHRPLVTVAKGPRPATVLFGLISILVAAYVIIDNLGGSELDLRQHLPAAVGAVGALLVLVGLVGVVATRRRR